MPEQIANTELEVDFEVVVIRCGCGHPESHAHLVPPQPCPTPRAVEDHGIVASNRKPESRRRWPFLGRR